MYKVGTRLKKVRLGTQERTSNLGVTGCVTNAECKDAWTDTSVRLLLDCEFTSAKYYIKYYKGDVIAINPNNWEPIIPEGHKPSEFNYQELMENLKENMLCH